MKTHNNNVCAHKWGDLVNIFRLHVIHSYLPCRIRQLMRSYRSTGNGGNTKQKMLTRFSGRIIFQFNPVTQCVRPKLIEWNCISDFKWRKYSIECVLSIHRISKKKTLMGKYCVSFDSPQQTDWKTSSVLVYGLLHFGVGKRAFNSLLNSNSYDHT